MVGGGWLGTWELTSPLLIWSTSWRLCQESSSWLALSSPSWFSPL